MLPLDDTRWFHKVVGLLMAIAAVGHIACHYHRFAWHRAFGSGEPIARQAVGTWTGISGHLIALCMIAMMFTGLERFRRRKWGKDWGGHSIFVKVHKLWVPVLVLLWTHSKAFWAYSLFPVGLILVDKLIGRLRGKEPVELLRAVSPTKDVLHLTMRLASGRRFKFQAGQYIFLQAPGISAEWHPFTLSSSPEERTFSLHIRCRSDMDWTYALRQMLLPEEGGRAKTFSRPGTLVSATSQFANDDPAKSRAISIPHTLFVDGPYGSASEEVFHFEVMVLVAAGIGVTPFASILKTLAKQAREDRLESPLKKVALPRPPWPGHTRSRVRALHPTLPRARCRSSSTGSAATIASSSPSKTCSSTSSRTRASRASLS